LVVSILLPPSPKNVRRSEVGARLTILGGYLGAGKTTLLNGALNSAAGAKLAVVVNDFGSVNIDSRLIRSQTSDMIELTNGCICCNIQDDTTSVMTALAERDLDHVLVEVSGVGDPAAMVPWANFPGYTYGRTVVCVDSTTACRLLEDEFVGDTVARQMASADLLVMTKTDLVSNAQRADSLLRSTKAAPAADVLFSAGGDITLAALLDRGRTPNAAHGVAGAPTGGQTALSSGHGGIHRQLTINIAVPVEAAALFQIFDNLPASVIRAKGILRLRQSPLTRTVVQYSAGRLTVTAEGAWQGPEQGEIVFITARGSAAAEDLTLIRERFRVLSGATA
jgi:G3E family GTPase